METIGRNDACWCGSGKKYKKCHCQFDEKLKELQQEGHIIPSHDMIKTPEQIEKIKESGKINLSYKDTLGTWEENADKFQKGMHVNGIVRETEKNKNGIFIELLPNLVGMAEYKDGLEYGQNIDVMIKKIDYDKKKVKLAYYKFKGE